MVTERTRALVSVVDDDASLRRSVANLLRSVGTPVLTFASAEEFLDAAVLERTDCIVLDLRMSGMNGLYLLEHLCQRGFGGRVLMLTAHADNLTRGRASHLGVYAFLPKPFRPDELLRCIDGCLARSAAERGA